MESPFKGKTGIKRIFNAAGYSMDGFVAAWRHEAAFRQVVLLALVGIALSWFLDMPAWGRGLIALVHLLTLVVELLNSAIEAAVDHTSLDRHELAKRAKDMGSAAQFVSLVSVTAIWLIVLGSR
ncbi:diacylglycerol kinase [Burkholderiaceae bacterium DAT-1]|nr:diacylglycerol kinase [Burkholderiaceae bacterium DAT-1]